MPALLPVDNPALLADTVVGVEAGTEALRMLDVVRVLEVLVAVDEASLASITGAEAGVNEGKSLEAHATAIVGANTVNGSVYCVV